MGFWEHLEELRGTIIKSLAVFVVFAAVIGYHFVAFNRVLMQPFHRVAAEYPDIVIELGTGSAMEGINVIVQACLLGALLLSAPVVLFFIGQFVGPALTPKEAKAVLPMCVAAFFLFVGGLAFGFFVLLPGAIRVTIEINQSMAWAFRWNVGSYYSMLSRLVLGVGAIFQFPLVIVLLTWLGLVSTAFLRKYRRHALVCIFVLAAIVTPSTDPLQQTLLALPLIGLYEIAIVIASRIERRRERSGHAALLALIALLPRRQKRRGSVGMLVRSGL